MKKKKKEEMKVIYHYFEPKIKEEKEEQNHKLIMAFKILFDATIKRIQLKRFKRHS